MGKGPESSLLKKLASLESAREVPNDGNFPRSSQRFVIRGDALLHPMNSRRVTGPPIEIKLRDISRTGAGFVTEKKLEMNSTWRMEFLMAGYGVGTQGIIIRHTSEVSDGMQLCGSAFIIDTAQLALLGIDPGILNEGDDTEQHSFTQNNDFLPPSEVA